MDQSHMKSEQSDAQRRSLIENCNAIQTVKDSPLIGPFFYIRGKLIYNACPLAGGREQAGKLDNSYGHDQLYDDYFKTGEYIYYPRGRVVWNEKKIHSIIYIDPCINRENVLSQIIDAFDIGDYV